ncbi:hypothetical protein CGGC5_v010739 [Colletotrichum fructicola Nara gc5]|uniref:Uncharacterized protein n=1 Tax=Colletotrichum fructicola (strain Nara gc5) TaxID=1213859 RepID=A0A7J6IXN9_COLFN|nr:hypothetical protein CGGC5_v010739 [Colletotrichum fructicola Nara gc5]
MDKITAGVLLSRDDSERDCSKSCFEPPGQLQANPDIGGLGVLISFMATAWLVVFLVMFRYCITFDPNSNPFHRPGKDTIRDQKKKWKPNTIDYKFTGMFKGLRGRLKNHGGWTAAINQILLNMGDAQIITGLGILVSSFINLNCYISAYHWQISTYLAWFSNLTHAACLSSLRGYLYERQMQRNFRMFFMAVLFVLLITAIVPTAYFNWEQRDSLPASSASFPASNTHCFFSRRIAHELWNGQFCSPSEGRRSSCRKPVITLSTTAAYESSVFSIILLGVGFIIRFVKMSRTLSDLGNNGFRERMDQWVMMSLDKLASGCQGLRVNGLGRWTLRILRPLDIMIALYLVGRLYTEILLSELAYLSWLFLASIWGSFRLYQARSSAKVEGSENEWQFGQILPYINVKP